MHIFSVCTATVKSFISICSSIKKELHFPENWTEGRTPLSFFYTGVYTVYSNTGLLSSIFTDDIGQL